MVLEAAYGYPEIKKANNALVALHFGVNEID